MSKPTPRIALSFGAFSCEIEGIENPLLLLQHLVSFCEDVEARNPDFGSAAVPLEELNAALQTAGPVTAEVVDNRLIVSARAPEEAAPAPSAANEDEGTRSHFAMTRFRKLAREKDAEPARRDAGPEPEISSVDDIAKQAQSLPDDQLASALDRAMTAGPARRSATARPQRPSLSVNDYAMPRMPRDALHALEIAAAWRHHIRGEHQFDRMTLLSDAAQINTRKASDLASRMAAFDTLVAQAVLRPGAREDLYTLSPALITRYER